MATIKNYTDLPQSKKLAEILPLESADVIWNLTNPDLPNIRAIPYESSDYNNKYLNIIPAWSLAALLNILPIVYINSKNEVCGPLHIDITDSETPFVLWYVNPLHKGSIVELKTKEYNNLVDACYEMIIKLKDLNLL